MKKLSFLTALLLFVATALFAEEEHLITVVVQDDGSARVTHQLTMKIDANASEKMLGIDYPDGVEVSDLSVSEGDRHYRVLGKWGGFSSVGRESCALEKTDIGYEITWSTDAFELTEKEYEKFDIHDQTFQVEYTLTGLVRHYDDVDGLSFMFVNKEMDVFEETRLAIFLANGKELNEDNSIIICEGFEGTWGWGNYGQLLAYTTDKDPGRIKMIVSAQFHHGLIEPSQTVSGTYQEYLDARLTEDFLNDKQPTTFGDIILWVFLGIIALVCGIGLIFLIISWSYQLFRWLYDRVTFGPSRRRNQQIRFVEKEVDYWRDLPFGGSIYASNYELNCTATLRPVASASEAINAYILRLIYRGCLGINAQGQLTVEEWSKDKNATPADAKHEKALYELLLYASGPDRILQEGEVEAYLKNRPQYLWPLLHLRQGGYHPFSDYSVKTFMPDAHLAGFRRFLKDFSLIGERHVVEVTLWREYMVFATLFGIADQVKKDMQVVCPEFLKNDLVTGKMLNFNVQTSPYASLISEHAAIAERTAPSSGNLSGEARLDYEQERQATQINNNTKQ